MDKLRNTRTYERYSLKYRTQQSKQLSDLFDKVTKDATDKDKHMSKCNTKLTSQDGNRRVKASTRKENEKWMECSHLVKRGEDPKDSPCPLFESICMGESKPKKSRRAAVCRPPVKGSKRGGKKKLYAKFQKALEHCPTTAQPPLSPAASPQYPSIEDFRDVQNQSFSWSAVHKESDSSCSKWLESLSDSFSEKTLAPSGGKGAGRPSFPTRPPTPAVPRQHSYIRIRTPLPVSPVQRPETERSEEHDRGKGKDEESSRYTTIYTWTTATATTTGTNTGKGGEEGEEMMEDSPTLMLKAPAPHPLQSTAIHPHLPSPLLHLTPHVSPIKPVSDHEQMHRTPSAPTHDISPRGPRKTQSFQSVRGRAGPPKCSTMLFASPMADDGDAPLDVSSIRAALSEAIDLNEDRDKEIPENREGLSENARDRVLTSTPCGRECSKKFQWNLSSVQAPVDDDDLLPMDSSRDTVNSEEIVADTWSESFLPCPDLQDLEQADKIEEAGREGGGEKIPNNGDAGRRQRDAESGMVLTSPTDHTTRIINIVVPSPSPALSPAHLHSPSSPQPLADSLNTRLHRSEKISQMQQQQQTEVRGQSACIGSQGDGFEPGREEPQSLRQYQEPQSLRQYQEPQSLRQYKEPQSLWQYKEPQSLRQYKEPQSLRQYKELPSLQYQDTPTSHRAKQRAADRASCSMAGEAGTSTGQPSQLSQPPQSTRKIQLGEVCQYREARSWEEGGEEADDVPPCPVSILGMMVREGAVTPGPPQPPRPGLMMWVEPADSGFLDMVSNTPPDIVSVVSRKPKEDELALHI